MKNFLKRDKKTQKKKSVKDRVKGLGHKVLSTPKDAIDKINHIDANINFQIDYQRNKIRNRDRSGITRTIKKYR